MVLSGLFELRKVGEVGSPSVAATVIATLVAFVTGYAAIAWLLRQNEGGGDGYDVLTLSGRGDKDMDEVTAKLAELDA